jgi:transcriptional regulator with XRE-family HTH domain
MSSLQFPNYLRANRKRLALSQDDVAYLLGRETGEKVCRHERFLHEPGLATALAYEVIFRRSVSELFDGLYKQVEQEVVARAKVLATKTHGGRSRQRIARKRQALAEIADA